METQFSVQTSGKCPICAEAASFSAGRGFCPECFLTFPAPRVARRELLRSFELRYFMSKKSGFYHQEGCKYLRNVDAENLIITSEPWGQPCKCVR